MTERSSAADAAPLRLAVIDTDSGFLQVLTKRLERLSWEHRVLASAVPVDTVVAMRLNAIVVDLAALGPPEDRSCARRRRRTTASTLAISSSG